MLSSAGSDFAAGAASLTATINHVPCGIGTLFLMPYKKVAHHCLFKLIVDPHWQRKGNWQCHWSKISNIWQKTIFTSR